VVPTAADKSRAEEEARVSTDLMEAARWRLPVRIEREAGDAVVTDAEGAGTEQQ
jgi:hypothetical protein